MIKNSPVHNKLARKNTMRLAVSVLVALVGLLLMYSIQASQRDNPPPDANIGAGMIYLMGLCMAVAGGAVVLGSIVHILIRSKSKKPWLTHGLPVLIVGAVILGGWYVVAGVDLLQKSDYGKELESRYGNYIAYQEPVDYSLALAARPMR